VSEKGSREGGSSGGDRFKEIPARENNTRREVVKGEEAGTVLVGAAFQNVLLHPIGEEGRSQRCFVNDLSDPKSREHEGETGKNRGRKRKSTYSFMKQRKSI